MLKKFSVALIPLIFVVNIFLLKASKERKEKSRNWKRETKKLTFIIRTINIDIYSLV